MAKPREWWLLNGNIENDEYATVESGEIEDRDTHMFTKVREVIPGEPDFKELCAELEEALSAMVNSAQYKGCGLKIADDALAKYQSAIRGTNEE